MFVPWHEAFIWKSCPLFRTWYVCTHAAWIESTQISFFIKCQTENGLDFTMNNWRGQTSRYYELGISPRGLEFSHDPTAIECQWNYIESASVLPISTPFTQKKTITDLLYNYLTICGLEMNPVKTFYQKFCVHCFATLITLGWITLPLS